MKKKEEKIKKEAPAKKGVSAKKEVIAKKEMPAKKEELKTMTDIKLEPNVKAVIKPELKAVEKPELQAVIKPELQAKKETVKEDGNYEKLALEISFFKEKLEKLALEIAAIKKHIASEEEAAKEKILIETEAAKISAEEKVTPEKENLKTFTNQKTNTTMEDMDYKEVDDFINSQSRLNKWYDRKIEYTGNQTSILCGDIPVLREWESGKNKKGIAFTRMENKLGLVQLQDDGVTGVHLSPMLDEGYSLHENDVLAAKIKEVLEKTKFKESDVIMAFGGGIGFNWEEIIKLLSNQYTIKFIENNMLKRKWFVEVANRNDDEKTNNETNARSLVFTPIGQ